MRSRALWLAVAGLVVASTLTFGVARALAVPFCHHIPSTDPNCYSYGGQGTATTFAGIDGLVIASSSTLAGTSAIHVANWLGVSNSELSFNEWVQAGAFQGNIGGVKGITSATLEAYAEWRDVCLDYLVQSLGNPPPSPYGYYVWTLGSTTTGNGCGTQYIYYVRV